MRFGVDTQYSKNVASKMLQFKFLMQKCFSKLTKDQFVQTI